MKRSDQRILTSHTGSLPRPPDLFEMIQKRDAGEPVDADAFAARVRTAVADIVKKLVEVGIDIVNDGSSASAASPTTSSSGSAAGVVGCPDRPSKGVKRSCAGSGIGTAT